MAGTVDRTELVAKASTHLQRGELDKALAHYITLFKRDPGDWNIANTLGDLYVRMGRSGEAVDHFSTLAEGLASDGFTAKARALYRKILRIQPQNTLARLRVEELDKGVTGASPFLQRVLETARTARESRPPAPDSADAPMAVLPAAVPPVAPEPLPPVIETPSARDVEITLDLSSVTFDEPAVTPPTAAPASVERRDAEDEYRQVESAVDAAIARGEFTGAAAVLEQFLTNHPHHIAALERLIDLGVDGRLEATLLAAQVRLAEACLEGGTFERARDIAVDLIFREPTSAAYSALLDRVMAASKTRGRHIRAVPAEALRAVEPVEPVEPVAPPAPAPLAAVVRLVPVEQPSPPAARTLEAPADDLPADLREWSDPEQAFDDLRTLLLEEAAAAAEERMAEAERLIAGKRPHDAIRPLEEAMCVPHLRAPAGARLARLYRDVGEPLDALACLEWVAEVPPASEEHGHELAYELAVTLEALGQQDQALGIYRELLSEVGASYRDIAVRTARIAAA